MFLYVSTVWEANQGDPISIQKRWCTSQGNKFWLLDDWILSWFRCFLSFRFELEWQLYALNFFFMSNQSCAIAIKMKENADMLFKLLQINLM
jgi:hypothetical protein